MTQHEKLFESLPPTRLFFRCALPSMISMAMLSLYTVADGIFVGRYVGPNALAAVNLVMPLIMMSFALVDLVAVGSSVQISIRLGEKNERAANRIFSFCTGLIVALSCVIGLGGFFLAGGFLAFVNQLSRGGVGWGDVKLLAASGLLLGAAPAMTALLMGYVIAGLWYAVPLMRGKISRKTQIPMAPFFAVSLMICGLWFCPLFLWYMGFFL